MRRSPRYKTFAFLLGVLCLWGGAGEAQTFTFGTDAPLIWQKVKGTAQDVGVSPSGSVYVVSRQGRIWRWGSVLGEEWKTMPGHGFVRVDVGSSNKPWAVTKDGQIRYFNGLWWELRGDGFIDVGAGRKGVVYGLGKDGNIARWDSKEKRFVRVHTRSGKRIDVGRDGKPWLVDDKGTLLVHDGEAWSERRPGVSDVSVGPRGSVFVTQTDGALSRWNPTTGTWLIVKDASETIAVSVGPGGKPWVVAGKGRIYATSLFLPERLQQVEQEKPVSAQEPRPKPKRRAFVDPATLTDTSPIKFTKVKGHARDIAIGADGSVFIARTEIAKLGRYSNARKRFIDFPGELSRMAVASDGSPWGVNSRREIFRHNGRDWVRVRGASGIDIAIGANGDVFVTDPDQVLHKLDPATGRFKRYPGVTGTRVAVDPKGKPWVINAVGVIRRCDVDPCQRLSKKGRDIAIGPDGSVLLVDTDGKIQIYEPKSDTWKRIAGVKFLASAIAVGPKGRPWAIDLAGQVYAATFFARDEDGDQRVARSTVKRTTTSKTSIFTFTKNIKFEEADVSNLGGIDILDLSVGADGTVVGVESSFDANLPQVVFVYNSSSKKFETTTKKPSTYADAVAIAPDGEMWTVDRTTAYVYEQIGNSFKKRTGLKFGGGEIPDIAVGANGAVFAIDTYGTVYRYDSSSKKFKKFVSGTTYNKIAVDPLGIPWVKDNSGLIYQYDGTEFVKRGLGSGVTATDLGIGAEGSVYVTLSAAGALKRWNASNQNFDDLSNGTGGRISVSPEGRPWFIAFGDLTKVFKPKK